MAEKQKTSMIFAWIALVNFALLFGCTSAATAGVSPEECLELEQWSNYLKNRVNPSVLGYALRMCREAYYDERTFGEGNNLCKYSLRRLHHIIAS